MKKIYFFNIFLIFLIFVIFNFKNYEILNEKDKKEFEPEIYNTYVLLKESFPDLITSSKYGEHVPYYQVIKDQYVLIYYSYSCNINKIKKVHEEQAKITITLIEKEENLDCGLATSSNYEVVKIKNKNNKSYHIYINDTKVKSIEEIMEELKEK